MIAVVPVGEQSLPADAVLAVGSVGVGRRGLGAAAERGRRGRAPGPGPDALGASGRHLRVHRVSLGVATVLLPFQRDRLGVAWRRWRSGRFKGGWRSGRLRRKVALAAAVVLLGVWIGLGGRTIREGIRLRASPALGEADLAKAAYEQLAPQLKTGRYKQVVFLDVSEVMWSSMHGGNMIRVFFPGLRADCDGRDGFQAPRRSGPTPRRW